MADVTRWDHVITPVLGRTAPTASRGEVIDHLRRASYELRRRDCAIPTFISSRALILFHFPRFWVTKAPESWKRWVRKSAQSSRAIT